jgi:hypothetical protein
MRAVESVVDQHARKLSNEFDCSTCWLITSRLNAVSIMLNRVVRVAARQAAPRRVFAVQRVSFTTGTNEVPNPEPLAYSIYESLHDALNRLAKSPRTSVTCCKRRFFTVQILLGIFPCYSCLMIHGDA